MPMLPAGHGFAFLLTPGRLDEWTLRLKTALESLPPRRCGLLPRG